MKEYMKLQSRLRRIEQEIYEKFETGEADITEQEEKLEKVKLDIITNIREHVHLIKGGFFKEATEKIDEKIEELAKAKSYLEKRKEFVEATLYNYLIDSNAGSIPIFDEEGNLEFYLSQKLSIRRSIADIEKVNETICNYKIPTLTFFEKEVILDLLTNLNEEHRTDTVSDLLLKLNEKIEKTVSVTVVEPNDEDPHPAVERKIRPTVSITKSKPKEK